MSEWSWANVRRNIHWDDFLAGLAGGILLSILALGVFRAL